MFSIRSRGTAASLLAVAALSASLTLLAPPGRSAQGQAGKYPLAGTWTTVTFTMNGKRVPEEQAKLLQFKFQEEKVTISMLGKNKDGTFKVDATKDPKQFDMALEGEKPNPGIYRLETDKLTLCFSNGGKRPTQFASEAGSGIVLLTLKRGALKVDPAEAKKLAEKIRVAADKLRSQNNLKQMALAMHNYHDTYRHLPGPAIYSKDGKPLLSWRVAILPFVEQLELYKQFKLHEPWDSPHNKKLLEKMPKLYEPVRGQTKQPYTTYYQVFVGPGTAFEAGKKLGLRDFPDGTSNTILIVEAGEPVPWTKPADLPYNPQKDLPKLGGLFDGDFNAVFADAAVDFISRRFDPAVLRLAITRNDGQPFDRDKLTKP